MSRFSSNSLVSIKTYIVIAIVVALFLFIIPLSVVFKNHIEPKRERIIPQKPFIVIGYHPIDLNVLDKGVQYDVIDNNGYIFHFSEYVSILDKPRYMLGDTLK